MRQRVTLHRAGRLAPALALSLGSLLSTVPAVRAAELAELVRSHGLLPVDPPRPAADFELPRFGGGRSSLSDFQAHWVVLTFWASWCAPCRAEMPSLEQLHRSHAAAGVAVVGVSVDLDRSAADAFADSLGLTFPLLWDEAGRVGASYQAVAIPMSYLVDPAGRIVAMARGARDWTRLSPLMDALAQLAEPGATPSAVYADAIELPTVLDPPSAELELSDPHPTVGEEFFLDIRLRWAGHLEEYLPQAPKVYLPAGLVQRGVAASTSSREGAQVVLYRVALQADEVGSFALDPVELRYRPRFATSDAATRLAGPTVEIRPRTLAGFRPLAVALGAGSLVLAAVVGLALGRRWRVTRASEAAPEAYRFERLMARYQAARGLRLQGDGAGSALTLLELLEELEDGQRDESDRRTDLEESLRYGGRAPAAEELDRLQRTVGRKLEALRPDPDAAAREALRVLDEGHPAKPEVEENA